MDSIGQARKLYKKHLDHKCSLSECDQNQLEADIKRFIYVAIKEITPASRLFANEKIFESLKQALGIRAFNNWDVRPVTKAFDSLESYFVLLVEQPWKPEFKKLKMYGGFYRTKIKPVLRDPEPIFKLAGYDVDKNPNVLIRKIPVRKDHLLALAFDCRVASSECRMIDDHYNKVKSLNMTVGDAISHILNEASFLSSSQIADISMQKGEIVRPPAIPKREGQVNGLVDDALPASSFQHSPVNQFDRHKVSLPNSPRGMTYGSSSHHRVSTTGVKIPPAAPSVVVDETLLYLGDVKSEILPVLPEGTTEDHMRESLKLVDKQKSSKHVEETTSEPNSRIVPTFDDYAWYGQPNLTVTLTDDSNRFSALTYPPGFSHLKNQAQFTGMNPASIDEGIASDLSTISKPSTRYLSTANAQSVLPNKASFNYQQQPLIDPGYRTLPNSEVIAHLPPSSGNPPGYPARTIYRPPLLDTDGDIVDPANLGIQIRSTPAALTFQSSLVNRQAPPIPPRELKPQYKRLEPTHVEDILDGTFVDASTMAVTEEHNNINGALRRPTQALSGLRNENFSDRNGAASQTYPIASPDEQPNIRRSRISSTGRSGSLKTGEPKSPLAQVVAQSRVTRSMDFTHTQWECKSCTTINVASDKVCIVCAHSRHGKDESAVKSGESRKSCPLCTYENLASKTHCEMCNSKLPDAHTFI